ncbi:hypothetical protein PAXRUDRAFT_288721 [Paxillus rubicundulus Ve08.2h10]|uniref:Uncharacterized protein n=1 Tax=Paxillus rubicundulus Ve08.2h10 TaxID=930991 RepID=A0A0D0E5K7_9AGAM|nr:hypothetical protein PAXRUDRAFT_288721 [Paxillus rubicundulus Ve08.2h10]
MPVSHSSRPELRAPVGRHLGQPAQFLPFEAQGMHCPTLTSIDISFKGLQDANSVTNHGGRSNAKRSKLSKSLIDPKRVLIILHHGHLIKGRRLNRKSHHHILVLMREQVSSCQPRRTRHRVSPSSNKEPRTQNERPHCRQQDDTRKKRRYVRHELQTVALMRKTHLTGKKWSDGSMGSTAVESLELFVHYARLKPAHNILTRLLF